MKKRALLFSILVFSGWTLEAAANETRAAQIARLEADFRRAPRAYTLAYLAEAREADGQWSKASASWDYLARRFGDEESDFFGPNSDQNRLTYRQVSVWMKARIRRKIELQLPGAANHVRRGRALRAAMRFMDPPPVAHLDARRNIDLDGDKIDEIIVYGRSGPLGRGKRNSLAIWKWNGEGFAPIWSKYANLPTKIEYADHNTEWNELGDAFFEVVLFFSGADKRVQTLRFNGSSFISTIVR